MQPHTSRFSRRRGTVVVIVLVTIVMTAMMLTHLIDRSSLELIVASKERTEERLKPYALDALEITLATLADALEFDESLFDPAQGWDDPYTHALMEQPDGLEIEITYADESGKLSLPNATSEQLVALGEVLGLTETEAERMADGFLLWMREDYTPKDWSLNESLYERMTPGRVPPLRSPRSYDELALIEGVREFFYDDMGRPNERWTKFKELVSLYTYKAVNLNHAPVEVLTLLGLDEEQIATIDEYRTGVTSRADGVPPYFRSTDELQTLLGARMPAVEFSAEILCLRINITVHQGRQHYTLSTLITKTGDASLPVTTTVADTTSSTGVTSQSSSSSSNNSTSQDSVDSPFTILDISSEP